jgi:hypothetical protein
MPGRSASKSGMTELLTQDHSKAAQRCGTCGCAGLRLRAGAALRLLAAERRVAGDTGGVERSSDGKFDRDVCRLKYLTYLRSERARSPRAAADANHAEAKTELLQIRIEEKKRASVRRDAVDELTDALCGITLTHLSGMSARCSRDMQVWRNIDAVVDQIRREMAAACLAKAEE